jgi:hypothetical protein
LASTSVLAPLAAPFAQAKIVPEDGRSFWTTQAMRIMLKAGPVILLLALALATCSGAVVTLPTLNRESGFQQRISVG